MSNRRQSSSTPILKGLEKLAKRFEQKVDSFEFNNSSPSFDTIESSATEGIISISSEVIVDIDQQTANFQNANLDEENQPLASKADDNNISTPQEATTHTSENTETAALAAPEGGNRVIQTSITCTEEEIKLLENCLTLRSGKVIHRRRSKSVENKNSKKKTNKENKNIKFNNNFGVYKSSNLKDIIPKMSDLNAIAQIINNVPFLYGEETPDLSQEVNNFVRCCENILACLTEPVDIRTFFAFLHTKIRGRAARLLEGFECKTFDELKSALYNKLVNTKPYYILLNELRSCRQYPYETVKCFGERINTLFRLGSQKIREKHTGDTSLIEADLEETAIFAFKAGLVNPNYRLLIWQDSEKKLGNLVSKLSQIEESEKQILHFNSPMYFSAPINYQIPQYPAVNSNQSSTQFPANPYQATSNPGIDYNSPFLAPYPNPTNSQNSHIQNNFQPNEQKPPKKESLNQENTSQKFKCGFCGEPNHNYAQCRTRKATPFCTSCRMYGHNASVCPTTHNNRSINTLQKKKANNNQLKCDFCQRKGHTVENCFAKQTWEANFNQSTQKGNSEWAATHEQTD